MKTISPLNQNEPTPDNPAADLVRQKLANLYSDEPNAKEEIKEATSPNAHQSKHQRFMYNLTQSGMSLAEIQTQWHNYYVNLPNHEKHEVWQEFYQEHERRKTKAHHQKTHIAHSQQTAPITTHTPSTPVTEPRSVKQVKQQLLARAHARPKHKGGHVKSLLFGLACGSIVIVILLFSFFNERFIAPFITPSKTVSDTQIIIDPTATAAGPEPKIIIPKINAELPVVYSEPSIEEHAVQRALEDGVLHYATTPNPGEQGNGVIFGHSSNNILNKGKYKFAFVLLKRLETGDTFIIQKDGKRYVYKVFAKKVVKPEDVDILNDSQGKAATFSLVTCDPPGTSLNRLVVTGEQITPDPMTNVASSVTNNNQKPKILPSNSPSLWQRFTNWLTS